MTGSSATLLILIILALIVVIGVGLGVRTVPQGTGVRVDTYMHDGAVVPPYYDSLIAKLIAWGRNRDEALARMRRALAELRIDGVRTLRLSELTFQHLRIYADDIVTVSEADLRRAARRLLTEARLVVEPTAALPLAALLRDSGADVTVHWQPGGHALTREEAQAAAEWLAAS